MKTRRLLTWMIACSLAAICIFGAYIAVAAALNNGVSGAAVAAPVEAQQPATLSKQLAVTVAPVDAGQVAALVQQAELQAQLSIQVAPVDAGQIDALVRQHRTSHGY